MTRALALVGVLAACRPSSTEPMPRSQDASIQVGWTVTRTGDSLAVVYHLKNPTKSPIYVLDQPVVAEGDHFKVLADRAYVQRGTSPHLVSFVRGWLGPDTQRPEVEQDDHDTIFPAVRTVPAGGGVDGAFQVPLPVTPWRPGLEMAGLREPQRAVLEIGYVTADGPWTDLAGGAAGTIRTATRAIARAQVWVHGDELPLP